MPKYPSYHMVEKNNLHFLLVWKTTLSIVVNYFPAMWKYSLMVNNFLVVSHLLKAVIVTTLKLVKWKQKNCVVKLIMTTNYMIFVVFIIYMLYILFKKIFYSAYKSFSMYFTFQHIWNIISRDDTRYWKSFKQAPRVSTV